MPLTVKAESNGSHHGPVDWQALKAEIISKLDIAAEYAALGVEFTKATPGAKGWRECLAYGRKDARPSGAVNVASGIYKDSGDEGTVLSLWDFALRFQPDRFGRYLDVLRHYASKAGVDLPGAPAGKGGRILEATYDYRDAAGVPRYRVYRYRLPNGSKSFSQHPILDPATMRVGHGAGCMDGVSPLPYRLPELLASADPGETVLIVEGEKDVERLAGLGFVATTSHGGVGMGDSTWPKFDPAWFLGRACVVLPDNDPGGLKHAIKVCAHLRSFGAASVKLLELPGLPPKGDVSTWLDQGRDADELGTLAHQAKEWDPADDGLREAPAQVDADDAPDATVVHLRRYISATAWLWPLWIPTASLTLLAAEAGTGKTRFCFDLHRRLFNGFPWPDGTEMPLVDYPRILWVVADNQHQEMCDLPTEFGIPDDAVVLNTTAAEPFGGTSLQSAEELADFEERIARVRPVLAVIDTVTNTSDLKAQDASDAKRQYKPLQEIAIRQKVPILCVTHLNAGGKVLGRRATEKVRVVIQLDHPDKEGQPNRRKLWVEKTKALKPPPLGVTMRDGGNDYDETPPVAPEGAERIGGAARGPAPAKTRECMAWLERRLAAGRARVSVLRNEAEAADFNASTLYRARDLLRIQETEVDGRKWWELSPVNAVVQEAPS